MAVEFKTTKLMVPIDKVRPNRWNPNQMDSKMFAKQKKSIEEIGFLGSILVRDHEIDTYYEILDGEHRWKALKEAGATEVPVETIGKISDQDAQLLTVLINNLHGTDDVFKRARILQELNERQLSLLPMTQDEIEHEKQFVKFDFSQYDTTDENELEEGDGSLFVVLHFNQNEAAVWNRIKEELLKRKMLTGGSKKKQDVQLVMKMAEHYIGVFLGSNPGQKEYEV